MYINILLIAAASLPASTIAMYNPDESTQAGNDGDTPQNKLLPAPQDDEDMPSITNLALPIDGDESAIADDGSSVITGTNGGGAVVCQVRSNEGCEDEEFCLLKLGGNDVVSSITRSAQKGVCTIKPDVCTLIYDPVCGFDNQNYASECNAWSNGTSAAFKGECETESTNGDVSDESTPSGNGSPAITATNGGGAVVCQVGSNEGCEDEEFCLLELGGNDVVSSITRSAQKGVCTIKPDVCTLIYDPVCGFDNQNYASECVAWSNGTSAAFKGECEAESMNGDVSIPTVGDFDFVGPSWTALKYYDAASGELENVVPGSSITLEFQEDGHFGGHSGCNTYSGGYSVTSDSSITVSGPLASTMMICADEAINQQEYSYLQIFQGTINWSVSRDETGLELTDDEGNVLAQYVSGSVPTLYTNPNSLDASVDAEDSGAMAFGTATALAMVVLMGFIGS